MHARRAARASSRRSREHEIADAGRSPAGRASRALQAVRSSIVSTASSARRASDRAIEVVTRNRSRLRCKKRVTCSRSSSSSSPHRSPRTSAVDQLGVVDFGNVRVRWSSRDRGRDRRPRSPRSAHAHRARESARSAGATSHRARAPQPDRSNKSSAVRESSDSIDAGTRERSSTLVESPPRAGHGQRLAIGRPGQMIGRPRTERAPCGEPPRRHRLE